MRWRGHRLGVALLCAGALAGAAGWVVHHAGVLRWAEQRSVDARFALRGRIGPSSSVVIVGLDTESYRRLPLPPIPRTLDATLIERLTRAGARVIAFDFALERPSASPSADAAVIDALSRSRSAIASVTAIGRSGQTAALAGRIPLQSAGVRPGVTLLSLDSDGAVRRFPDGLGGVESFALAAARSYSPAVSGRVPAGALIDYPGPAGTVPTLRFIDVLEGRFAARSVRGKVVVIGPTAPVLQDLHRAPLAAAMPGPEIQADAVASALEAYPLRYVGGLTTTLILFGLGLTVPLLASAPRSIAARSVAGLAGQGPDALVVLAVGALVAAGWSLLCQLVFDRGTVLDYSDGLLTVGFATVGSWLLAETLDRRERRRLRRLFAASSPEVVDRVLREHGPSARTLSSRSVIAGYQIEMEIGRGGMGVVYRASQLHLGRDVALKLIRPEYADSALYRARFERESRLAAAVSHPNVIPVLDAGDDDGLLYLAMQLIAGTNLASALKGSGFLDPKDAAILLHQIAGALDAAHDQMLVHRDVKPANIVLRADDPGHALLTDFGLAKSFATSDQLTRPEGWVGTIDYLAPEQLEGRAVDQRADIYALTAVLYHCLTGAVPFPREETFAQIAAHINATRPSALTLRPELPPAIDLVIARGMAVSPSERYASAGALAADAGAALGVPARRAAQPPRTPAGRAPAASPDAPTEIADSGR